MPRQVRRRCCGFGEWLGARQLAKRGDPAHKTIALTWNRLDLIRSRFAAPQRLSQRRDVVRQIPFFDDGVGPDGLHQGVFRDQPSVVFDQHAERIEHLSSQRHGLAVAKQAPLANVEQERPELVDSARLMIHVCDTITAVDEY